MPTISLSVAGAANTANNAILNFTISDADLARLEVWAGKAHTPKSIPGKKRAAAAPAALTGAAALNAWAEAMFKQAIIAEQRTVPPAPIAITPQK